MRSLDLSQLYFITGNNQSQNAPIITADWTKHVNSAQTEAELESVRRSVWRGTPFGQEEWQRTVGRRLGLQSSLRPRGRPPKQK